MGFRRVVLAAGALLASAGLAACSVSIGGHTVIDQNKVKTFLKKELHPAPASISCPSGVRAATGGTYTCTVVFPDGRHARITLHMTNAKGHLHVSNKDIHYES
jgi:hypothetical protein